ncbi:Oxidoreductase, short chain dehydrogenase/reductase family protein [Alloalcanivorax dieselolei B5]|uniref:Oxidoreductase, short chain dehydrogenase/reductase family protein n=1 Tax=Alcanivorax dieselolei (strain DSM 16502 / CGMCC 1.3690 / MCCC 1A00001 / B-5) TaxID=930169 RepID=K0CHA1_ALCDB|nr:glucose 1-dehydrogenase [Alloalcanivorax dieselolei]AFT71122.1 Oxidoreductase, short chain dehydrogenase/reductase family protein [Alloalcanivorax dieselolei B5]GGJ93237.1 3-oxoacyl-ACP reductase [Alloalcanivorax dieselolei]
MTRMKDKVVIITGAAQGIGAVYAKALAAEGARVVIADVLDGAPLAEEINASGAEAMAVRADVADEVSAKAMAQAAMKRFGRIDVLVNNAAIYASLEIQPFEDIDLNEWDKVMAVNVRGPFICARAVAPRMKARGYGRIINISSGTPFKGTPNLLHYVTSKGAVLALTRALARELGEHGIAVNTLAPGLVLSEGVIANQAMRDKLTAPVLASRALKRDQTPEDLIGPLLFLASDESAFMTGESVVVDGGSVMH